MKIRFARFLLMIYDAVGSFVALGLAFALRYDGDIPETVIRHAYLYIAFFIGSALLVNLTTGNYYSVWKFAGFAELLRHFFGTILLLILLYAYKFLGILDMSGTVIYIFILTYFLLSMIPRFWSRFCKWMSVCTGYKLSHVQRNVLIIGAGYAGAALVERMFNVPREGLRPVALIDDDKEKNGRYVHGLKIVGDRTKIPYAVEKYNVDEIIISIPSINARNLREIYEICSGCGVPVQIVPSVMDFRDFMNIGREALKKVSLEDLLFRKEIHLGNTVTDPFIEGKVVLVTGGAGSIGSEICRQVLAARCKHLIVFDICENSLFKIDNELKTRFPAEQYSIVLGSVRDVGKLDSVFSEYKPEVVLHAAAHKHVPLMQANPVEAIKNNIFGTLHVIQSSMRYKVKNFILISTDKAVNPVNIMGATKRFAELLVQVYNNRETKMAAVRFGNVLGSNGSVIPIFKEQIAHGGPLTVTHPDMQRYFMTIPEAVALVLQAGTMAWDGGEIFILDMGKPVKIYDLACDMIRLSGLRLHEDIEIKITGIRPGEKLYEELSLASEDLDTTTHEKIFICHAKKPDMENIRRDLSILRKFTEEEDMDSVNNKFMQLVNAYGK